MEFVESGEVAKNGIDEHLAGEGSGVARTWYKSLEDMALRYFWRF